MVVVVVVWYVVVVVHSINVPDTQDGVIVSAVVIVSIAVVVEVSVIDTKEAVPSAGDSIPDSAFIVA